MSTVNKLQGMRLPRSSSPIEDLVIHRVQHRRERPGRDKSHGPHFPPVAEFAWTPDWDASAV